MKINHILALLTLFFSSKAITDFDNNKVNLVLNHNYSQPRSCGHMSSVTVEHNEEKVYLNPGEKINIISTDFRIFVPITTMFACKACYIFNIKANIQPSNDFFTINLSSLMIFNSFKKHSTKINLDANNFLIVDFDPKTIISDDGIIKKI